MAKIGLLAELDCEIPDTIQYTGKEIKIYRMGCHEVGVFTSGIGQKKAINAAEKLCREYNPEHLMFVGFCRGIKKGLDLGDLVVADRLCHNHDEISLESAALDDVKKCLTDNSIKYHAGKFRAFDHVVISKKEVPGGIIAADTGSYAIAKKSKEYKIPTVILKVVSDIIPEKNVLLDHAPKKIARGAYLAYALGKLLFSNAEHLKRNLDLFSMKYFK